MNTRIPHMATIVPEGKKGRAEIQHRIITEATSKKSYEVGDLWRVDVGTYAMLRIDGDIVMSDTKMERESNQAFINQAHGNVLIAGLGIGMLPAAIVAKPDVELVHVVEMNQDVIDLVQPHLPQDKLFTMTADVFELPRQWKTIMSQSTYVNTKYDCIYFDIWPTIEDNEDEMLILRNIFDRFLNKENPNHFIGSWMEDHTVARLIEHRKRMGGLRDILDNIFDDDADDLDVNLER